MDFTTKFLGSPIWLWLIFLFILAAFAALILYVKREAIRGRYYKFRYYERIIEVCIHFTNSNIIKPYWRLIPTKEVLEAPGGVYRYDKAGVVKNDIEEFAYKEGEQWKIKIEGVEYDLDPLKLLKVRHFKYAQIHYFSGVATPIIWDTYTETKGFLMNPKELQEALESDVVQKAFSLARQDMLILMTLIISIVGVVIGIINFAQATGAIK